MALHWGAAADLHQSLQALSSWPGNTVHVAERQPVLLPGQLIAGLQVVGIRRGRENKKKGSHCLDVLSSHLTTSTDLFEFWPANKELFKALDSVNTRGSL